MKYMHYSMVSLCLFSMVRMMGAQMGRGVRSKEGLDASAISPPRKRDQIMFGQPHPLEFPPPVHARTTHTTSPYSPRFLHAMLFLDFTLSVIESELKIVYFCRNRAKEARSRRQFQIYEIC